MYIFLIFPLGHNLTSCSSELALSYLSLTHPVIYHPLFTTDFHKISRPLNPSSVLPVSVWTAQTLSVLGLALSQEESLVASSCLELKCLWEQTTQWAPLLSSLLFSSPFTMPASSSLPSLLFLYSLFSQPSFLFSSSIPTFFLS